MARKKMIFFLSMVGVTAGIAVLLTVFSSHGKEGDISNNKSEVSNAYIESREFLFPEIWKKLEVESYDDVITLATPISKSNSKVKAREANKILGLVYFKQSNYQDSIPFFEAAATNSEDVNDWFNIVTSSTLAGQIEKGVQAFDRAVEIQIESGNKQKPHMAFMHLYYACALRDVNENELAMEHINILRSVYEDMEVTDTTFLHIRSIPSLSHTMNVAIDVSRGLGSAFDSKIWFKEFSSKLDVEGQAYLAEIEAEL